MAVHRAVGALCKGNEPRANAAGVEAEVVNLFAIDPGPVESAWLEWDGCRIVRMGISPNEEVVSLCLVHSTVREPILAIERIASYGMPVGAEVFETCVWTGRFIQAAPMAGIIRIPRKEICVHLCSSARAKDSNIRQALIDR